jgi:hypothetical protein
MENAASIAIAVVAGAVVAFFREHRDLPGASGLRPSYVNYGCARCSD